MSIESAACPVHGGNMKTRDCLLCKISNLNTELSSAHGEILRVAASLYAAQDRAVRAESVLRQIIKGVNDPQFTAADYFGGYDKVSGLNI